MRSALKLVSLVALSLMTLVACGGGSGGSKGQKTFSDTSNTETTVIRRFKIYRLNDERHLVYEYAKNGCSTGEKNIFASTGSNLFYEFCQKLADDSFNNNCALDLREEAFKYHCPENSWERTRYFMLKEVEIEKAQEQETT